MKTIAPSFYRRILAYLMRKLGFDTRWKYDYQLDRIIQFMLADDTDAIFFDVGANSGQSIERFFKLSKSLKIHAFEPIPQMFRQLESKYSNDNRITLNNYALGSQKSSQILNVANKTGISSINSFRKNSHYIECKKSDFNVRTAKGVIKEQITINVDTLDAYVERNEFSHISLLKIDTEGHEDEVLAGANQSLSSGVIDLVEVEIILDNRFDKELSIYSIEQYLIPNGYRLVGFDDHFNFAIRKVGHLNFIYAKDELYRKLLSNSTLSHLTL